MKINRCFAAKFKNPSIDEVLLQDSFLAYSGVWERFSQGYNIPFIPEVILSNLFEVFGATSNNFFHPRLISPDLFWCVGVSASQEKNPLTYYKKHWYQGC